MKSAIFQEQREPRPLKKTAKPARSQSPFTPPRSANGHTWHLDDVVANYTATGTLPTPLSPTLPPEFHNMKDSMDLDAIDLAAESDIDNMPMLLLSPTLPNLSFESPTLLAKVKWINRLRSEKPRFLLRITFSSLHKYKLALKPRLPRKTQGLGIYSDQKSDKRRKTEDDERSHWLKVAKEIRVGAEHIESKDAFGSLVRQIDWILALAIAHDKSGDKQWLLLNSEVLGVVGRAEKYIKAVPEKRKDHVVFFVGQLVVLRALVLRRVNNLLMRQTHGATESRQLELQKAIIDNWNNIGRYFGELRAFLNNLPADLVLFPRTWHARLASHKANEGNADPASDRFFLPLGPYSSVREACAYVYSCLKEYIAAESLKYTLQAHKRSS